MLSKGLGDPQESIDHTVRSAVLANSGQVRLRENEEWVLARSGDWLPLWILVELQSVGRPWAVIRREDILGRTWYVSLGIWEGHSVRLQFCSELGYLGEGVSKAEEQWERGTF